MKTIPFGSNAGQTIASQKTTYLMWILSRDAIRHKRPELIAEILGELRARFADFDKLSAELRVDKPPAQHWKTPELLAARAAKRASNRALAEQKREAEALARLEAHRASVAQRQAEFEAKCAQYELEWRAQQQPVDAAIFVRENPNADLF